MNSLLQACMGRMHAMRTFSYMFGARSISAGADDKHYALRYLSGGIL